MPTRDTWASLPDFIKAELEAICPRAKTFYREGPDRFWYVPSSGTFSVIVSSLTRNINGPERSGRLLAFSRRASRLSLLLTSLDLTLTKPREPVQEWRRYLFDATHRLNRHSLTHQLYVRKGIHADEALLVGVIEPYLHGIVPVDSIQLFNRNDGPLLHKFLEIIVLAARFDFVFISSYHDIHVELDHVKHAPAETPELFGGDGPFEPNMANPVKMVVRPGVSC